MSTQTMNEIDSLVSTAKAENMSNEDFATAMDAIQESARQNGVSISIPGELYGKFYAELDNTPEDEDDSSWEDDSLDVENDSSWEDDSLDVENDSSWEDDSLDVEDDSSWDDSSWEG